MRKWDSFFSGALAGASFICGLFLIIRPMLISSVVVGLIVWCIVGECCTREAKKK